MRRLLFEKLGNAVWISHLDLMRLFQRAFKRAGLHLTHTQGFNPRPSVSIALPLSVGIESRCELLDFELDGQTASNEDIQNRLNEALVDGIRVLSVYDDGKKIGKLAFLDCTVDFEYDSGVPGNAACEIEKLFAQECVSVEKKSKNGPVEQNIIPMIRSIHVKQADENTLSLQVRVCCQNPSLNPMLLCAAVAKYLPELAPDYTACRREALYDLEGNPFK